jgi:hypothetical protein
MIIGGQQPRLMLLTGAQRAPGFLIVVDFPGQSPRVADEVLTAVGNAASDEHRPKDRACQLRDDTRRGPAHLAAASFPKPPLARQSPPRAPGRVPAPRRHGPPESGEHCDREQNASIPLAGTFPRGGTALASDLRPYCLRAAPAVSPGLARAGRLSHSNSFISSAA